MTILPFFRKFEFSRVLHNSSSRRLTHDCFGKMIQQFASKGSPITKGFCFENDVFLTFGLGMREGVGEGSRNGKG